MKSTIVAGLIFTLSIGAQPSQGGKKEDAYVACLIGQAAVALHRRCDAKAAQAKAYQICKSPGRSNLEAVEGIGDYVNMKVTGMASECSGQ